jgi:hypothetical protein
MRLHLRRRVDPTCAVPTIPVITDRLPDVEDAQRYAARAARVNRRMAGF